MPAVNKRNKISRTSTFKKNITNKTRSTKANVKNSPAVQKDSRLKLRAELGMTRELFSRLVNSSVRTIAKVESNLNDNTDFKFSRNYVEVDRLCKSLSEVIDTAFLGDWFNNPNEAFGGLKPVEVIERGEIDKLWDMAFRLRSGISI